MAFRASSDDVPTLDRSFRGYWHTKDATTPVSGTVSYSLEEGLTLDLNGTLLDSKKINFSARQVLGEAVDGTELTVVRGQYTSQKTPGLPRREDGLLPPVVGEVWQGQALAVGARIALGGKTLIKQLHFRSPMLRAWTVWLAPKYTALLANDGVGGSFEVPPPIRMKIAAGPVQFEWIKLESFSTAGASIRFVPDLHFSFDEAITIDEAWKSVVIPMLQFLTFCVGAGDSAEGVLMNEQGESLEDLMKGGGTDSYQWRLWGGWFEWLSTSWMARPSKRQPPHEFEYVCQAPKDDAEFAQLIETWFERYRELQPALFDFLSVKMWASMTIEESFYRVVRALEIIHGILNSAPHIPKADFGRMKSKVKGALDGEEFRDFLLGRMAHLDEPSLRERLEELVAQAPNDRLQNHFQQSNLIGDIVKARNDMTHAGATTTLGGSAIYDAYYALVLLMNATLLRELGVSNEVVNKRLWETSDARPLVYAIRDDGKG